MEYYHPNIKIVFCNGLRMKLQEHARILLHVLQLLQQLLHTRRV
jgi:hypothetical protein